MKTIQTSLLTLFAAILMTTSWASPVTTDMPPSEKKELRAEITKLLESVNFNSTETKAKIRFAVTSQNILVILDVVCDDAMVKKAIIKQLNRKKIKSELSNLNQKYNMTFELKPE